MDVRQHHKLCTVPSREADGGAGILILARIVGEALHRHWGLPDDLMVIYRVVDRPLVGRLPLWRLCALCLDHGLRAAEDGDRFGVRADKVEAGADGLRGKRGRVVRDGEEESVRPTTRRLQRPIS